MSVAFDTWWVSEFRKHQMRGMDQRETASWAWDAALEHQFEQNADEIRVAAAQLLAACDGCGKFSNGVTDATGSYDEGEVLASRAIERLRAALHSWDHPISAGGV